MAAPGPSLLGAVRSIVDSHLPVIVVGDAWRALPSADVLYAADNHWWEHYEGVPQFAGEKWTTHQSTPHEQHGNDKTNLAKSYGLHLVLGDDHCEGFSLDPFRIAHGSNSGFQAINLAILFGCKVIVLCGFDMHGTTHFFGDHPEAVMSEKRQRERDFSRFVKYFARAVSTVPDDVSIINATPGSALRCFRQMDFVNALEHCRLYRNGAESYRIAG